MNFKQFNYYIYHVYHLTYKFILTHTDKFGQIVYFLFV
nr:MAG TPA: hypothetical protein [Caudoviricetes sp.]